MALLNSVAIAQNELQRLNTLSLSSSVILDNRNLVPPPNQPPIIIQTIIESTSSSAPSFSLPESTSSSSIPSTTTNTSSISIPSTSLPSTSSSSNINIISSIPKYSSNQDIPDEPLSESQSKELLRLENTIHDLTEINDRIMAQNIALLGDLEAAQRAVRELRGEKDALALQLRKVLEGK